MIDNADPGLTSAGLVTEPDGHARCLWCAATDEYRAYHDVEWGRPVTDDTRLFEKICLEGFQAGLSWLTILRKRENFRRGFAGFEIDRVADFTGADIERLLADAGIIRHRGKIEASIHNARQAQLLRTETGSLAAYFWSFEPAAAERPATVNHASVGKLASTLASHALSRDLRRRGWKFVGPTTAYAFMQAMGLVNDHFEGCSVRDAIEIQRRRFKRPGRPAAISNL